MTSPERRKHARGPAAFAVTYRVCEPMHTRLEFGEDERQGAAKDLGVEGLCLATDQPLPNEAIVWIRFMIGGEGPARTFELRGEVCYCRTAGKDFYYSGVRFEAISEAEKKLIALTVRAA